MKEQYLLFDSLLEFSLDQQDFQCLTQQMRESFLPTLVDERAHSDLIHNLIFHSHSYQTSHLKY